MEVTTKVKGNPIKQDEKNGLPRKYNSPMLWNYGCFPQTWEDPSVKGDANVGGAFGDNDPLDVMEIGSKPFPTGSFVPVKVLGVLAMTDNGELDWKVIVISDDDELAPYINDVDDIEKFLPGTVSGIREWLRWYKTPDGKPKNEFGYDEKALGAAKAKKVIEETHEFHAKLLSGLTDAGKLWVPSAPKKAKLSSAYPDTSVQTADAAPGPTPNPCDTTLAPGPAPAPTPAPNPCDTTLAPNPCDTTQPPGMLPRLFR